MRILLLGASGFIGSGIGARLLADGHEVVCIGRDPDNGRSILPAGDWRKADLRRMTSGENWAALVDGIEVVVNASGALQTGLRDDVRAVQRDAVSALSRAAAKAGVRRFVQISAVGAGDQDGEFMATKGEADTELAALCAQGPMACTILRPGLVIGRNCYGGTELLRAAAAMPGIAPRFPGTGEIQCVALADVVAAAQAAVARTGAGAETFDLVEREGRSLGEVVALHRAWLGLPNPRFQVPLNRLAMLPAALCADALGWLGWRSPLRSNAMRALTSGVTGRWEDAQAILGRPALSLEQTLSAVGSAGRADRWHARMVLLMPLALLALAALWIGSGVVGLLRTGEAAAILVGGGLSAQAAKLVVLGGSFADIAIGIGLAVRPFIPLALKAGLLLAAGYLAGSVVAAPQLWLDPLGPMLKVLPALALTGMVLATVEAR